MISCLITLITTLSAYINDTYSTASSSCGFVSSLDKYGKIFYSLIAINKYNNFNVHKKYLQRNLTLTDFDVFF